MVNLYTSAREEATAAAEEVYAELGLACPAAVHAEATLRDAMNVLPGVQGLMRRLEEETVRIERGRGGVTAEFDLRGTLRELDVRSRYAVDTEPTQLAFDVCSALRECEETLVDHRRELAAALADDRSF